MESTRTFIVWIAVTLLTTTAHAALYDPAAVPTGPVAAVTLSNSALTQDSTLYQPWFDAAGWSGDLLAFAVNPTDGQAGTQRWSAAQLLTARDWHERLIVTRRDDTGQAVSLRRFSDLSTAQQAALGDQAAVDYLRGDPTQEGMRFRTRYFLDNKDRPVRDILGPTIHADPRYLGNGDTARLFIAANDGMLHVFSASDGHEQYAYVPGMLYRNLSALIDNSSAMPPPYTVDGGIAIAPVQFRNGSRHTVLVGALGPGGQGLYALDVSNPVVTDEAKALKSVLWEFTDSDDSALGYVHGTQQIAQLNDGRWVVLVGNGYASNRDDGHNSSGTAALLIIDIESGTLLRRIDTYASGNDAANGLGPPRSIDVDADGRADYAYAGDLQGNLWRFDLRDANSGNWRVSFNSAPLYSAHDADGHVQPITSAPAIIAHPQQGVRILFGTGRLLSWADLDPVDTTQSNALYGVRDRLDSTLPDPHKSAHRTLVEHVYGEDVRVLTIGIEAMPDDPDIWRVDLPAGARIITDSQLDSGQVLSNMMRPLIGNAEVWLLAVDAQNGGASAQVGFDMNGDGKLDAQDNLHSSPDGAAAQAGDRIAGRFYGIGQGSAPVTGNLNASRRVTYINRIAAGPWTSSQASAGNTNAVIDDIVGILPDIASNLSPDVDTTLTDSPLNLIDLAPACGVYGCVAEARRNPGRVAWKELLAE